MIFLKKTTIKSLGIFISIFLIIIYSGYGFLSNRLTRNFFEEKIKVQLVKDANIIATEIELFIGQKITLVDQMKTNQDFMTIIKEVDNRYEKRNNPIYYRVTQQLNAIKETNKNLSLVYIALANASGSDLITDIYEYDSKPDYDLSKREWYVQTKKEGKTIVTDPYLDVVTGEIIVSVATPIVDNGKELGSFAVDVMIDDIYTFMDSYKVGEEGYIILFHRDGRIFYYPHKEVDMYTALMPNYGYGKGFFEDIELIEGENREVFYKNKDKYITYVPVKNTDWIIGTVIPKSEATVLLDRFMMMNFFIFLIVFLVIILFINKVSNLFTKPIIAISKEIESFTRDYKDINLPNEYFSRKDEIGILANGLDAMTKMLSQYLGEIEAKNKSLLNEIEDRKTIQGKFEVILKILSDTKEGIFILDDKLNSIYRNKVVKNLIENKKDGLNELILNEKDIFFNEEFIKKLDYLENWTGEIEYEDKEQSIKNLFLKIDKIPHENNSYYYAGTVTDLTEYKKNEKDIYYLKYFDSLTKVYNKRYLQEYLKETLNQENIEHMNALIIINIDNFRIINEAKGFNFGNAILINLAERLRKFIGENEILVRVGSDEFAIFKSDFKTYDYLYNHIISLDKELGNIYNIEGEELFISTSIGVSIYPNDAVDESKLLETATSALNNAKNDKSSNFQFYNKNINNQSIYRYELQNKLRNAIEKNELRLYYQPQIDMKSNEVIGIEALIRWKTDDEMIPTHIFIPIAESSNLILKIGEWVLLQACQFGYKLYKDGHKIQVAVNLSKLQFKEPYITILINSILEKTKFPPDLLELEITESLLMENENECETILKNLKNIGIKVAIDDFGTGYSSLSYLKKFSVDKIKIDRSFIKDIPNYDNGVIAKVIIELAENLELKVIAEGVETEKQRDFLLKNNCKEGQGYLYAKPMPEEELISFLESIRK